MDAQAGWRRYGLGGGGVRRPGATSGLQTNSKPSKTSTATTRVRAMPGGAVRASNQSLERGVNSRKSTSIETEAAPSRWKEMRQSVRTKATLETVESRPVHAKIADLCPEDRDKVAKLVQRIVEVGTLQEEGEKEFSRQKQVLEAEVKELREKVRQDDEEIQELTGELRSTRRKAQLFEERALVLEESTDAETRSRLDAEQTLDLLKLEVDKLRALVQRQQEEIQRKAKEQQQLFDAELAQVKEELKETQELLLKERNERVLDKQKALDQRLERSAVAGEEKLDKLHALLVEQQQDLQRKAQEQEELLQLKTRQQEDGRRTAKEQQERHDAEVAELKRQLQAAEQLLQQERQRIVERPRVAAVSTERSTEEASEQQDAVRPTQAAARTSAQRAERFATDMQGDLAMFEEVKDLYAEDLFASRRWGAVSTRPSSHDSSLDAAAWQFASTSESSRPPNSGVGPALSEQELSVQEAVDRDMEALLRSETLDTLH